MLSIGLDIVLLITIIKVLHALHQFHGLPLVVFYLFVALLERVFESLQVLFLGGKDAEERLLEHVGHLELLFELREERSDDLVHALVPDDVDCVPVS